MRLKILLLLLMIGLTGSIWVSAQIPSPPIDNPIASIDSDLYHPMDASWGSNDVLAIGGVDGLRLYDPQAFRLLDEIYSNDIVHSVAWDPAGRQLALSVDDRVEIWDWDNTDLTLNTAFSVTETHTNLEWSPDGTYLASLGIRTNEHILGKVYTWNKNNNWQQNISAIEFYFTRHMLSNSLLDWRHDSEVFALRGRSLGLVNSVTNFTSGAAIFLIAVDTLDIIDQFEVPSSTRSLDWRLDGNAIVIGYEGLGAIYDLALSEFTHYVAGGAFNTTVHWSPDQTKILLGGTIVDPYASIELGIFNVSEAVIVSLWRGDRIFIAQVGGRYTIEDPALARGVYATFTPEGYELTITPTSHIDPVADAGPDQTVYVTDATNFLTTVTVDASGSTSLNGNIVKYRWVDTNNIDRVPPSTNPIASIQIGFGVHTIDLIVEDVAGKFDRDTILIHAIPVTLTPIRTPYPTRTATPAATHAPVNH